MDFTQTKTCENLARAFAGECMEGARYQFLAQQCHEQKFEALRLMLKTIAKEEMSHAKIFFGLITKHGGKMNNVVINAGFPFKSGTTEEELMFCSEYEKAESTSIYPAFAKVAEDEGFHDVAEKFRQISLIENAHYNQMHQLHSGFKNGTLYKNSKVTTWRCGMCGATEQAKEPSQKCAVCGATQGYNDIPIEK